MPVYRLPDDNYQLFPHPSEAESNGLIAVSRDLHEQRLVGAYANGLFPWFEEDGYFYWYTPDPRWVLKPAELCVHKSMRSIFNGQKFRYTLDTAFPEVMQACASTPRFGQEGSWISDFFIESYTRLHKQGVAHSVEVWEGDQLAGIPKAPDTLLDILLDAGVLTAPAEGSRNWAIFPTGAEKPIAAVRLASPAIVLAGHGTLPAPLNRSMQRSDTIPSPRATVKTPPVPASHPAPPIAKPAQLSLIEADPNPVPATIAPADDAPKSDYPPPPVAAQDPAPAQRVQPICLKAPMRLNPAVRQALVEAVETLNDPPATTSVFTVREGIFIPLAGFERRGIQATVALRALADADMLYSPRKNGPPTATRDVQGVATVGIVLLPRHVDGLDPLAFAAGADAAT